MDFWAWEHLKNPKLREEDVTDDFDAEVEAAQAAIEAEGPKRMDQSILDAIARFKGEAPALPKPPPPLPDVQAPGATVQAAVVSEPGDDDFETIVADTY